MMHRRRFLSIATLGAAAPRLSAQEVSPFTAECTRRAASGEYAQKGLEGWLFLTAEMKHLAAGTFWTAPPPLVARLASFTADLKTRGVAYLATVVPAKAAIHPDKLLAGAGADAAPARAPLIDLLQKSGVPCIDLDAAFRASRTGKPLFCTTDAHWSPAGITIAADAIINAAGADAALKTLIKPGVLTVGAPRKLDIEGDLTQAPGTKGTPPEILDIIPAGRGTDAAPVPADPKSPVILMGDSHTMVFTDGKTAGMHCTGAGLRDHLQARFGFALTQISNQNSGTRGAQRILAQRALADSAWWAGRKLVIQVFSEREFTTVK